jgi:prepilin-type N-terminal cleavage/methylation domain-containing protein
MLIKNKNGFTLIELLVSIIIFSFMVVTLSTVYATANRYFFQSYREDLLKNNFTLTFKFIENKLSQATEIVRPGPPGSPIQETDDLAFYTNFQKIPPGDNTYPGSGCAVVGNTAWWHYFCVNNNTMYYYTGSLTLNTCPNASNNIDNGWISSTRCGEGFTIVLSSNIYPPTNGTLFFGRTNLPPNIVRVSLRLFWQSSGKYNARNIDTTKETYIMINKPAQW